MPIPEPLPQPVSRPSPKPVVIAGGQGAHEVNGIAATVNGRVVTKKEVGILLAPVASQLMAQFPREQIDYQAIKPGDGLHIVSRQVRSFEPDYMI